ncbi:MAG: flagellar FlbD family protein [Desulfurococcales archaeon]|nr:flagellar FlbD family protein [Desulfurococcales archaeon]
MIELTSLHDEIFYLNIDRMEKMQVLSDTLITLIDGKVIRVKETPDEIIEKIIEFKNRVGWR